MLYSNINRTHHASDFYAQPGGTFLLMGYFTYQYPKQILTMINEKCPGVAINTEEYTTYGKYSFKNGIFEDTCIPYLIEEKGRDISNITEIGHDDIQKKYHEFTTILRQHNVSGRENAFDKLVNLFLAKIVDEIRNSDKLQFYWGGDHNMMIIINCKIDCRFYTKKEWNNFLKKKFHILMSQLLKKHSSFF